MSTPAAHPLVPLLGPTGSPIWPTPRPDDTWSVYATPAAGDRLADRLDRAYRATYGRYRASILNAITSPTARTATVKIDPHN